MLCRNCGWHRLAGRPATTLPKEEIFESFNERLKPGHAWLEWVAVHFAGAYFSGAFIWALARPETAARYTLVASLFVGVVFLMALVAAFRQSVWHGLATLFLPFYVLFFVYARSDSTLLKGLTGVAVIARLAVLGLDVPVAALEMK